MVNVGYVGMACLFLDDFVGSMFGVDEQDFVFVGCLFIDECQGIIKGRNCLFQVNDVNFVMGVENEFVYFGILEMGLVIKVNISF